MKIATVDDLIDADTFGNEEAPPHFDRDEALARIAPLQQELGRLTGLSFEVREAQDATFFAELDAYDPNPKTLHGTSCIETYVGVRFSAFGNLFTIWSTSSTRPLADEERLKIAAVVSNAGFLYAPLELLKLPYSGVKFSQQGAQDWWYHFFEYS